MEPNAFSAHPSGLSFELSHRRLRIAATPEFWIDLDVEDECVRSGRVHQVDPQQADPLAIARTHDRPEVMVGCCKALRKKLIVPLPSLLHGLLLRPPAADYVLVCVTGNGLRQ